MPPERLRALVPRGLALDLYEGQAWVERGTLEDFLIERYVLHSGSAGHLLRARIHHRPWPLREVSVLQLSSTLLEANGLPAPTAPVLAHAQAEPFDVEVWPPTRA